MPAGLQAWDAAGNLVADLGDFTVRFVSKHVVNFPKGQQIAGFSVNGINGNNSFAVITASSVGPAFNEFYAKTKTNGVDILYLATSNTLYARDLTVEVYEFI